MINLMTMESDIRQLCNKAEYNIKINADYYVKRPVLLRSRIGAIKNINRHLVLLHILDNKSACIKIMEVSNEIKLLLHNNHDHVKELITMYLKNAERIVLGHSAEEAHPNVRLSRPMHRLTISKWQAA